VTTQLQYIIIIIIIIIMTKLTAAFRKFANAPTNIWQIRGTKGTGRN